MLVQAMNLKDDSLVTTARTAVAVDTVGAGEGEYVLVTQGSSARLTDSTRDVPADAVIVGIIDAIQVQGNEVFKNKKPS